MRNKFLEKKSSIEGYEKIKISTKKVISMSPIFYRTDLTDRLILEPPSFRF